MKKKDKDKRLIQNWRPLNVDVKIISKALSKRLKNVLPSLISDNQSAYVDGRFINKGGRLIANALHITDVLKLNAIQKAFDLVDHQFLTLALKKYGFSKTFIKWIKLDQSSRQADPISAYLFIFVLEIVFHLIKQNKIKTA